MKLLLGDYWAITVMIELFPGSKDYVRNAKRANLYLDIEQGFFQKSLVKLKGK